MSAPQGRVLSSEDLLAIWELGEDRHDADKALLILAAAHPELPWEELVRLPIGSRDGLLIRLRAAVMGPQIPIGVQCPRCQERLEFETSADELLEACPPAPAPSTIEIEAAGFRIKARPLDSRDLSTLKPGLSRADARRLLVRRAVVEIRADGAPVDADALPAEAVSILAARLAEADPAADLDFALNCPACNHAWVAALDMTTYFWRELTMMAQSMLEEVHALAAAYGWSERDILAMAPGRRKFYLSRIAQ